MDPFQYHDIGQYLRESRESLRVSIEQAAHDLHIRGKYIRALEAGDLREMPGKAYIRGYISNYAHYLRLDVDKVLEAYGLLVGTKSHALFIPEASMHQNVPTNRLLWLSLIGLGVIYACWFFGFHDRTQVEHRVGDVPQKLAHLLDKTPPLSMLGFWEMCLGGDNDDCWFDLRQQTLMPKPWIEYDDEYDNAAQKP